MEGHDPPQSCPYFGKPGVESNGDLLERGRRASKQVADQSTVSLPSGQALSLDELEQFLRKSAITLISFVGDAESGKTTLLAAIYERFLRGRFSDFSFSGSQSLFGFEHVTHHSRTDSGRLTPETIRTSMGDGPKFFHLSLVDGQNSGRRVELMLADRAGEYFRKARDNSMAVKELVEVSKAECISVLLDGKKLTVPAERVAAMQGVRQIIRVFLDTKTIHAETKLQVITTKLDLLAHMANDIAFQGQMRSFRERLFHDFSPQLASLTFHDIASRDPSNQLPAAHGIDELMRLWCCCSTPKVNRGPIHFPCVTEFDRLTLRTRAAD